MNGKAAMAESGASLKWLCIHFGRWAGGFMLRHYLWTAFILFVLVLLREEWQPWAVLMRRYAAPIALSMTIIAFSWIFSRGARWFNRVASMLLAFALVASCGMMYEYLSLFVRYQSFKVEVIDKIPETDHERIQPLRSIHDSARGVMGDSRIPAQADYVWRKNKKTGGIEYQWTMAVEPGAGTRYWLDKVFGSIEEVLDVSGTAPAPDFTAAGSRVPVRFSVAEGLWLSSNANTAAIRSFDPDMFFNYEPTDVRYLEDDAGKIVEVISLLRWRGIVFPYPEFGGVLVVKQVPPQSTLEWTTAFLERVAFGAGEWIPPERVHEFPYLRGQNILPYRVSRYIAESLRFMKGFMAPFPGWNRGDVRIPDSKESMNPQPYATPFKATNGLPGMLYHYFSLEPYLEGNHGLVASVLIPADGTQRVFVYKHEERGESLIGSSMVPGLVRDSKKGYPWEKSAPVEERPYVRYVDGKRHMMWLTTVITYKDAKKDSFVAGSIPEVALVDAAGTHEVIWVDPRDQAGWMKLLPQ